jgi:hypothetical protein
VYQKKIVVCGVEKVAGHELDPENVHVVEPGVVPVVELEAKQATELQGTTSSFRLPPADHALLRM